MKNFYIVLGIIVVLGLGYYFISKKPTADTVQPGGYTTLPSSNTTTTPPTPMKMPATSSAPTSSVVSNTGVTSTSPILVNIQGFAFNPTTLTVKVGTKVRWTNLDSGTSHTVTSDTGSFLNSPMIATGHSYDMTFTTAGTYTYHCTVHPSMKGTIVVTN